MNGHKIIFEGPELSGKSWLMSQVYDFLEPKYNSNNKILNGCHWFNCDVGVFGTEYGQKVLLQYLSLLKILASKNVILEKFHLTEAVYQKLYQRKNFNFKNIEEKLQSLEAKIILILLPENIKLIKARIQDRLNLYPHYQRILQKPEFYLQQQEYYLNFIKKSKLDYLIIETQYLPDTALVKKIIHFLKED